MGNGRENVCGNKQENVLENECERGNVGNTKIWMWRICENDVLENMCV